MANTLASVPGKLILIAMNLDMILFLLRWLPFLVSENQNFMSSLQICSWIIKKRYLYLIISYSCSLHPVYILSKVEINILVIIFYPWSSFYLYSFFCCIYWKFVVYSSLLYHRPFAIIIFYITACLFMMCLYILPVSFIHTFSHFCYRYCSMT